MFIAPPLHTIDDPERCIECESAITRAILAVEKAAVEAGWNPMEVAIAMVDLGAARLRAMIEGAEASVASSSELRH